MNYIRPQEPPHSPPPQAEEPPFFWLSHLLSFIRRRWPRMAAAAAVFVALGALAVVTSPPRYAAEADLLFDVRHVDLLRQQTAPDALTLNSVLESQVEVLQSAGLARKAVERLGLGKDRRFVPSPFSLLDMIKSLPSRLQASIKGAPTGQMPTPEQTLDLAAQQLRSMVGIRRIGQTYVVAIYVTSVSAAEAAWLANGIAETYLADELQAKEAGIQQATGWLQVRLQELHDQAVGADRAVQDFKASHNIVDTDKGLLGNQQLSESSSQLVAAKAKTAATLAKLQRIESIIIAGVDGGTVADGLDNKVIVGLRQHYVDDERRVAELTPKFGKDHTAVRNLIAEMDEIKKAILGELTRIADTYRSDYAVARSDEASVQDRLDRLVSSVGRTNNDLVELRSLQSSADTYRSLYQNFLQRYTQAVQDQSFPVPEARIITKAVPPMRKSEPKTTIILVFCGVIGLSLGFIIAFIEEVLDSGIRNPASVREMTGFNCLAQIPKLRRNPSWQLPHLGRRRKISEAARDVIAPGGIKQQVTDRPRSTFTDAVRSLRIRIINQRLRARDLKVIGCLPNTSGAGASVLAANLAQILAQTGCRTLLIDWDIVSPTLSSMFGCAGDPGCLDCLADCSEADRVIQQTTIPRVNLMPAGSQTLAPTAMMALQLDRMRALLEGLRGRYDYVIVDLPSLATVADTHIAAYLLDAILVVLEWGLAEKEPLLEKISRLGLDETSILGVILNKVDRGDLRSRTKATRKPASMVVGV